jgi:hypothetical protein
MRHKESVARRRQALELNAWSALGHRSALLVRALYDCDRRPVAANATAINGCDFSGHPSRTIAATLEKQCTVRSLQRHLDHASRRRLAMPLLRIRSRRTRRPNDRIRVSWPERRAIAKATIQHSAAAGLSLPRLRPPARIRTRTEAGSICSSCGRSWSSGGRGCRDDGGDAVVVELRLGVDGVAVSVAVGSGLRPG